MPNIYLGEQQEGIDRVLERMRQDPAYAGERITMSLVVRKSVGLGLPVLERQVNTGATCTTPPVMLVPMVFAERPADPNRGLVRLDDHETRVDLVSAQGPLAEFVVLDLAVETAGGGARPTIQRLDLGRGPDMLPYHGEHDLAAWSGVAVPPVGGTPRGSTGRPPLRYNACCTPPSRVRATVTVRPGESGRVSDRSWVLFRLHLVVCSPADAPRFHARHEPV